MQATTELLKSVISGQLDAALAMLGECIEKCPAEHWDGLIVKYPFWQVAYHTLCFVDLYLAPSEAAYTPRPDLHPLGMKEFDEEYPSRRFSREELLGYVEICRKELAAKMASETEETLGGPSGSPRLKFSRAEGYLYNMRHIQHHTGQLGAFLRRQGIDTGWISRGRV